MEIIFEVEKGDHKTIEYIKRAITPLEEYQTNGLDGVEIVAIVVALIPAVKDVILAVWPNKTITIKICNDFGSMEVTAKTPKELEGIIDQYLSMLDKVKGKNDSNKRSKNEL